MTRLLKDLDMDKIRCDECEGHPDEVFFDNNSGEVLSIICKPCKKAKEAALKAMAKGYTNASKSIH